MEVMRRKRSQETIELIFRIPRKGWEASRRGPEECGYNLLTFFELKKLE